MNGFPNSPRLLKGGIVLIDPPHQLCGGLLRCNTTLARSRVLCKCEVLPAKAGIGWKP